MTRNYQLVYYIAQKCLNYRDTGVSKKVIQEKANHSCIRTGFVD